MAEFPGACDISSRLLPTLYDSPSYCRNGTCYDPFGGVNQDGRGMEFQAIDRDGATGSAGAAGRIRGEKTLGAARSAFWEDGAGWRAKGANWLAEEAHQRFLLVFIAWQAGDLVGHFAVHARDGRVGESERLGATLHFAHGKVVIGNVP